MPVNDFFSTVDPCKVSTPRNTNFFLLNATTSACSYINFGCTNQFFSERTEYSSVSAGTITLGPNAAVHVNDGHVLPRLAKVCEMICFSRALADLFLNGPSWILTFNGTCVGFSFNRNYAVIAFNGISAFLRYLLFNGKRFSTEVTTSFAIA